MSVRGYLRRVMSNVRPRIVNPPVSLTFKEVVLHLRSATATDLALLRHWDEKPHVIASDPNDGWGWEVQLDRIPDWREQLIAEIDGRPIGFVQIIDPAREESHYWGDVTADLRAIDISISPICWHTPAK